MKYKDPLSLEEFKSLNNITKTSSKSYDMYQAYMMGCNLVNGIFNCQDIEREIEDLKEANTKLKKENKVLNYKLNPHLRPLKVDKRGF